MNFNYFGTSINAVDGRWCFNSFQIDVDVDVDIDIDIDVDQIRKALTPH